MRNKRKACFMVFLLLASVFLFLAPSMPVAQASPDTVDYYSTYSPYFSLTDLHPSDGDLPSAVGQSFSVGTANYNLTGCTFVLRKYGSPTGLANASLYAHSGAYGSSSVPTGDPLAVSDGLDVSSLTTSGMNYTFNFSEPYYQLQANTYYCIVFQNPTSGTIDDNNYVRVAYHTEATHGGNMFRYRGNYGWGSYGTNYDVAFYVYGDIVYGDPEYSNVRINSTRAENSSTVFMNWTCSGHTLSGYNVEHNNTGVMTNYSWTEMTGYQNRSEYTLTLNSTVGATLKLREICNDSNNDVVVSDWYYWELTSARASDLYTDGMWIKKTEDNSIVYLHGVISGRGADQPCGQWEPDGSDFPKQVYDEETVKDNLRAISGIGVNVLKYFICIEFSMNQTDSRCGEIHREYLYNLSKWCTEYGLYFYIVPYSVTKAEGHVHLPYPDYHDGSLIADRDEFIDFWANLTCELCVERNTTNLVIEFWDEPRFGEGKYDWMNVTQYCIDAVRRYTDAPIVVHWDRISPAFEWKLTDWIDDPVIYGSNIIYTFHCYRYHGCLNTVGGQAMDERPYLYADVKAALEAVDVDWVTQVKNYPLLMGGGGVYHGGSHNNTREVISWFNQLRCYNEWNISWTAFNWRSDGTQWDLQEKPYLSQEPWRYEYGDDLTINTGYVMLQFIKSNPWVVGCGNETVSGTEFDPYLYTDNVPFSESWSNGMLNVSVASGQGPGTAYVFWPVFNFTSNTTLTVTNTTRIYFENDTEVSAYGYYNGSTGLITISFDAGGFAVGIQQNASMPENVWQMTFTHKDWDGATIDSKVSWTLYNGSWPLTYTEGSCSLMDGTYTLKTYYHGHLINSTSLSTATYGNSTANIYAHMKSHQSKGGGFIAFNKTISTITVHSETDSLLNFTAENATYGGYTIIVGLDETPAIVKRNGALFADWTYQTGYVLVNTTELSTWEFEFSAVGGGSVPCRLTVKVVADNMPIRGAKVTVNLYTLATDSDGTATFSLPSGSYTVSATHNEETKKETVTVDRDMTYTFDFTKATSTFMVPEIPTRLKTFVALMMCLTALVVVARFAGRRRRR